MLLFNTKTVCVCVCECVCVCVCVCVQVAILGLAVTIAITGIWSLVRYSVIIGRYNTIIIPTVMSHLTTAASLTLGCRCKICHFIIPSLYQLM